MLDHKLRSKGIGSSEVAMLIEHDGQPLSPWGGPHTLWRRKTGRDPDKPTALMWRGRYIEQAILSWYVDTVGKITRPGTIRHTRWDFVVDSVDAIRPDNCCVEAKTIHFSQHHKWGQPGTDEIPLYYATQCQWHCGVHALPYCDVPVDTGTDLKLYRVEYDHTTFEQMVNIARVFWFDHIVADVEPPLDMDRDTSRWMSHNTVNTYNTVRDATEEEVALLKEYRQAKIIKNSLDGLEVRIKEAIGKSSGIRIPGTTARVTHKISKKGSRRLYSKPLIDCTELV